MVRLELSATNTTAIATTKLSEIMHDYSNGQSLDNLETIQENVLTSISVSESNNLIKE